MTLYNIFQTSKGYRITKWDADFNVSASYLVSEHGCECPAQHKPCKHMGMLAKFWREAALDKQCFYCPDTETWYDLNI